MAGMRLLGTDGFSDGQKYGGSATQQFQSKDNHVHNTRSKRDKRTETEGR